MWRLGLLIALLLAVLAVTAPAMAGANSESTCEGEAEGQGSATWTHEGAPLEEQVCIELAGTFGYEASGFIGFHGTVELELVLEPGGAGSVTSFHWTDCTGTAQVNGLPCTATTTAPNWPVEARSDGTILISIPAENPLHKILYADTAHTIPVATTVAAGGIVAVPDDPEAISVVELEANEFVLGGNPVSLSGELGVTGEDAGTYGIE